MGKHRIVLAAAACLILAGCAAGGPNAGEGSGMTNSPQPPGSSPATPSTPQPTRKAPPPPPSFTAKPVTPFPGKTTVRGTVREGVELGCMLLHGDDGKIYLLVGGDRAVIGKGGRLEVVGRPQPGLMTTCQQGIPFKVEQVRAI